MGITVHHMSRTRATRAIWLLEELGLDYDTKVYHREPNSILAPPELSEVHPSGAVPLVEDSNGIVYAESGAILEHFVEKYGKDTDLIWKNEQEEATIKYALFAGESNIFISGIMLGIHNWAVNQAPWGVSTLLKMALDKIDDMYARGQFEKNLANLTNQLETNGGYFCNGRFTVADIMYAVSFDQFPNFGLLRDLDEKYPTIARWLKRLQSETLLLKAKKREAESVEQAEKARTA